VDAISPYDLHPDPLYYLTRFLDGLKLFVHVLVAIPLTTRKTLICGAPIWASVAHLWCATHIKPLVFITRGARPRAPQLSVLSVEHLEGVRHA
jgi:hypothetical protein